MPFITSRINVPLTRDQETWLVSGLGRAIEWIPGKSEASLMLNFEDNCRLHLRGDGSRPMAYITVAVFGNRDHSGYEQLSLAIARLFQETLGMDPANVYIKYEDISAWSVAGRTFGRGPGHE